MSRLPLVHLVSTGIASFFIIVAIPLYSKSILANHAMAVLTAIAIPIFTSQLEKSREATDLANMRSIYAEVTTAVLTETKAKTTENGVTVTVDNGVVTATKTYTTQQQVAGWISDEHKVGDLTLTDNEAPAKGDVTISATSTGNVKIGNVEKNGTSGGGGSTGGSEGTGG